MPPASHGTKITSRTNGLPSKATLTMIDDAGESQYTVTMFFNKRKLSKATSSDYPMGAFSCTFTYDSSGRLKTAELSDAIEGRMLTYKYISFDAKGNWTKRSVTIRYFSIDARGNKNFIDGTDSETESRTITYY